ncbi:MAG: nuclear transport factor 2 family protein [Pyrinomonadaceae bacterium]
MMLMALAFCPALAQGADERDKLIRSIDEISRAYAEREAGTFRRLYIENYANIRGKPTYNLREQLIAMLEADSILLRAGRKLDYETIRYDNEPPQITIYGRTAIVNVAKNHSWQYRGQKCRTRTQATELWIKQDEEWKIAAGHTTMFQCDPKPFHPLHSAVAAIHSRTKPPVNRDRESERQVRELIRKLVAGRASLEQPFESILAPHVAEGFVSTDLSGNISQDRSILATIQMPLPGRALGFRHHEDAVLIYGDAALYTFRVRDPDGTSTDGPRQTTIFFARVEGRWVIAAAHTSGESSD